MVNWKISAILLMLIAGIGCVNVDLENVVASPEKQVFELLDSQVVSWNLGDHEGFMEGYWKSDSLQFISKNGISKGWKKVLSNYQKSFPNRDDMCCLTFENRHFQLLDKDLAMVTGQWKIKRIGDKDAQGWFSLIIQKKVDGWKIIVDHTW